MSSTSVPTSVYKVMIVQGKGLPREEVNEKSVAVVDDKAKSEE